MSACALALAVLVSGCAGLYRPAANWPDNIPAEVVSEIPPRTYFVEVYYQDNSNELLQSEEEYLKWVLRFYRGWGPAPLGWLGFEEDFLRDASPQSYEILKAEIQFIGKLVSSEWSKHERVRRIDSRMLLIWSEVIDEAKRQHKVQKSLELIAQDVIALRSGELSGQAIKLERYQKFLNMARIH